MPINSSKLWDTASYQTTDLDHLLEKLHELTKAELPTHLLLTNLMATSAFFACYFTRKSFNPVYIPKPEKIALSMALGGLLPLLDQEIMAPIIFTMCAGLVAYKYFYKAYSFIGILQEAMLTVVCATLSLPLFDVIYGQGINEPLEDKMAFIALGSTSMAGAACYLYQKICSRWPYVPAEVTTYGPPPPPTQLTAVDAQGVAHTLRIIHPVA